MGDPVNPAPSNLNPDSVAALNKISDALNRAVDLLNNQLSHKVEVPPSLIKQASLYILEEAMPEKYGINEELEDDELDSKFMKHALKDGIESSLKAFISINQAKEQITANNAKNVFSDAVKKVEASPSSNKVKLDKGTIDLSKVVNAALIGLGTAAPAMGAGMLGKKLYEAHKSKFIEKIPADLKNKFVAGGLKVAGTIISPAASLGATLEGNRQKITKFLNYKANSPRKPKGP